MYTIKFCVPTVFWKISYVNSRRLCSEIILYSVKKKDACVDFNRFPQMEDVIETRWRAEPD